VVSRLTADVVVILPYVENRVLLQLRDFNAGIVFPGMWGFFGGTVEAGEAPKDSAIRELVEEIEYRPAEMRLLETEVVTELDNLVSHSFFCALTAPLEKLVLHEGLDYGLYTLDEVLSGQLHSRKLNKPMPVIPVSYVPRAVRKLMARLGVIR